jgi:hypothetical protein
LANHLFRLGRWLRVLVTDQIRGSLPDLSPAQGKRRATADDATTTLPVVTETSEVPAHVAP